MLRPPDGLGAGAAGEPEHVDRLVTATCALRIFTPVRAIRHEDEAVVVDPGEAFEGVIAALVLRTRSWKVEDDALVRC